MTLSSKPVNPYVSGQFFFDIRPETANKWLIWAKQTTSRGNHRWYDSERNPNQYLKSNSADKQIYDTQGLQRPNSNAGYIVGDSLDLNNGGDSYAYWNFLAAPQFFDVQKYAGINSFGHTIPHDLGVEPDCIIIKNLKTSYTDWWVYHSELADGRYIKLNKDHSQSNLGAIWIDPTDTGFTLNTTASEVNTAGKDYIAYLFAKDTPYVKCGSYTGAGSGTQVNVGFKPRWFMVKSRYS